MSDNRTSTAADRKIGARIRSRRLEIDMSQERLAELLGVTFQQVQKYEKGVNRTAATRLWDIAQALQMDVGYFYQDLAPGADAAACVEGATAEGIRARLLIDTMPQRVRSRVLALIQTLADEESQRPDATKGGAM